jgi:hypothetical protein
LENEECSRKGAKAAKSRGCCSSQEEKAGWPVGYQAGPVLKQSFALSAPLREQDSV